MKPSRFRTHRAAWLLVGLWLLACSLQVQAASPAVQVGGVLAATLAPVSLRWEVVRSERLPNDKGARSLASFLLTASPTRGLQARGWSLYFNCVAGVDLDSAQGPFVLEQMAGTLFRLRPTSAFAGLAPGQSVEWRFRHPDLMPNPDKAPQGPYLVMDNQPDVGLRIGDYHITPSQRPEQLDLADGKPLPGPGPDGFFERHAAADAVDPATLPLVFPPPRELQRVAGSLRWTRMPRLEAGPGLRREAALAREWLQPLFAGPPGATGRAGDPPLRLQISPLPAGANAPSPEAYALEIDAQQGVTLRGASAAGVMAGLQSLRALLPAALPRGMPLLLPALTLRDTPRFEHRGLLLDVARNFHPKATVLRLLDLMARLKLNKLHLHLTDDEGWRLAIDGLPELTEFGARRGHSADPWRHLPPAYGSGPDVRNPDGSGHYSATDYVEILRFAAARHIEVIPEIEMPGHARAAVQAMQARARRLTAAGAPDATRYLLSDPADRSRYRSAQLYTDHLMDPGLPSTYAFIEHVVQAVVRLHRQAGVPLKQLHVGADELPAGAWSGSPASRDLMERRRLTGLPDLWNHFYDRVGEILARHGLAAGGWEELGARRQKPDGSGPLVPNEHFVGRGHTLYVWNNLDESDDLAYRLANAGYRVVLAPATTLYLDMAHTATPGEAGVNWAAYSDLHQVFDYVPLNVLGRTPLPAQVPSGKAVLTDAGRRQVAGIEATMFSEVMRGRERLEYLLLPRLLAVAERAWVADPAWATEADPATAARLHRQDWSRFVGQVGHQVLPALLQALPDLNLRIPPPGLRRTGVTVLANAAWPGLTVHYTADGSEPGPQSPRALGPIADRGLIRAAAFDSRGQRSTTLQVDNR
jgi:hexosaminidase